MRHVRRQTDKQADLSVAEVPTAEAPSGDDKPTSREPEQPAVRRHSLRRLNGQVQQLAHAYWSKKRLTVPVTVLVIIAALGAVPFSRYALLGLVIHEDVTVMVVDSRTDTPISKASVTIAGRSAFTSASGTARIRSKVGYQALIITKQYYQIYRQSHLVGLSGSHNQVTVKLVALGRLVPVTITDKLTGKPVVGATVKVLDTDATTASDGVATVVLPAPAATQQATISANGYNTLSESIEVTDQTVAANAFALTPAGKLYFLSNLSGKIDVVKTNLDGTDRQTVLAGTGYENQYDTVLLASRDWRYLALYAQRQATGGPEIDLIDTSTDIMTNIDEGNASFSLVGWDGDRFIYLVSRNGVPEWQSGQQALKSFDATTKSIKVLAQTTASNNDYYDWSGQQFGGVYIVGGKIVYALDWQAAFCGYYGPVGGRQATISSVNADGSGGVTIQEFSPFNGTDEPWCSLSVQMIPYDEANSLAIAFPPSDTNSKYYTYENGTISPASDINSQNFYSGNYPTFLLSPSGDQTFWSVYADGANNLSVGDQNGQNAKVIATESEYSPYGWYTDNYLLVEKGGNELYAMAPDGSGRPFKITDYYKPQVNYRGYGGGYGGL